MHYPVSTPTQLRGVLRALRESRKVSQAELGKRIGVSQRRIATIEANPGRASFDQLSRLIAALGARVAIEASFAEGSPVPVKNTVKRKISEKAEW
jgi:HTH-type transcriptional regulator / antitoxin HipB